MRGAAGRADPLLSGVGRGVFSLQWWSGVARGSGWGRWVVWSGWRTEQRQAPWPHTPVRCGAKLSSQVGFG